MELTGQQFIGNRQSNQGKATFQAVNPSTGATLAPVFYEATKEEVDEAAQKAETAFPVCALLFRFRHATGHRRKG